MNCDDARVAHLEDPADPRVEDHLRSCAECRAALSELTSRREVLSDPAVWEEPPPGLGERVEALITSAARDRSSSESRRVRLRWLGAAAVLSLVVAVGLVLRPPSPDWEVEVPGTALAPEAVASVAGWSTEGGTRLRLEASGLEPVPDGYVYELWLSEGPIHVSAGTFTGGESVEMWVGVERRDYPRLWVTMEPIDAETGPSTRTVLDTGDPDYRAR